MGQSGRQANGSILGPGQLPLLLCCLALTLSIQGLAQADGGSRYLFLKQGMLELDGFGSGPLKLQPGVQVVRACHSTAALLRELREKGVKVVGYVPNKAFVVLAAGGAERPILGQACWQGVYQPSWKISRHLLDTEDRGPVTIRALAHPGLSLNRHRASLGALGRVLFLSDDSTGTGHVRLQVAAHRVGRASSFLAGLDEVAWVAPARRVALNNDESTWVIQGGEFATSSTPLFAQGLTGSGEIIAIADSGLDTDACQFRYSAAAEQQTRYNVTQPPASHISDPDNKVITYYLLDGADAYDDRSKLGHGTHVAGCAAGDNYAHLATGSDPGRDPQDGMAPGAQIVFQDIGRSDGQQAGLPDSLVDMFVQGYASGARIHNNSFGKTSADTDYDADSREVDEAAWRMPELLIIFSSGNLGPQSGTLDGIGSTAKNSLVVGSSLAGLSNQGLGVCHFSSQGPAADGRIRPDLVAPGAIRSALETEWLPLSGTDIYGQAQAESTTDPGNNNCAVDQGYRIGTSFSAPLVAGGAALAREYFRRGFYPTGQPDGAHGLKPSAALLKALLVSSAQSIDGPLYDVSQGSTIRALDAAPTSVQGWGLIRLDRSLFFANDGEQLAVLNDSFGDGLDRGLQSQPALEEGHSHEFRLLGVNPAEPLRIVLCWTDPAGSTGSGRALVNDLDLEVRDGDSVLYRGNIAFDQNRSQAVSGQAPDDRNPLEQVILDPAAGDYTIRVVGRSVPGNGGEDPYPSWRQGYALVAVGSFDRWCLADDCPDQPDGGTDGETDGDGQSDAADGGNAGDQILDGGSDAGADPGGDGELGFIEGGCACGAETQTDWLWWLLGPLFVFGRRRVNHG